MSAVRVFLSYSSEDEAVAEAICQKLASRDIACWIASRDLSDSDKKAQYSEGVSADEEAMQAIEASEVLVLVFSAASNTSPRVRREMERAVVNDLAIVPFRLEDVPLSKSMEYFISTTHWLDALTRPLDKYLDYLAKTLEVLIADRETARHSSLIVQRGTSEPLPGIEKASVSTPAVPSPSSTQLTWEESEVTREMTPAQRRPQSLFARMMGGLRHELSSSAPITLNTSDREARKPAADSLNPAVLLIVEQQLAESVGPVAKVLVKRAAQESRDLSDLYQKLSEHVPAGEERTRFLDYKQAGRA